MMRCSLMICRRRTRTISNRIMWELVIKIITLNSVMVQHSKSQLSPELQAKRSFLAPMLAPSTDSISTQLGTLKLSRFKAKVKELRWKILPDIYPLKELAVDFKLLQALLLSKTKIKELWLVQERQPWKTRSASSLLACCLQESPLNTTPIGAQSASQTPFTRETAP